MTRTFVHALALLCGGGLLISPPLRAEPLQPDELLLIYNAADEDSRELAEYYAKARGVPADRLLGLNLERTAEDISREAFEKDIRAPIRAKLESSGLRDKVRCLVTFYGLPIRVGKQDLSPEQARLLEKWRGEFQQLLNEFRTIAGELDPAIARKPRRPRGNPSSPEAEFQQLQQRYNKARISFYERAQGQAAGPEGQAKLQELLQVMQKIEGLAGMVNQVNVKTGAAGTDAARQLDALRNGLRLNQQRIKELLQRGIDDPAREQARTLIREDYGLAGLLLSLERDIAMLRPEETNAAVDSELALLWYDEYPRYRWIVNTMNWRARAGRPKEALPENMPPGLMVSRIDGPTPAIARGLIDKALAGEKAGPAGRVCIDARGMSPSKEGYGPYDEYLRRIAGTIRTKTKLPVRLDNNERLLGPGSCPETVLYCGWYSLRKYVDAFDFVPGAIGYHLASFEAETLKRPGSQVWVKRMLEDGITATLGPVAEPYLQAFPRPDDFFGLLLTGQFTLAEAYAYSVPFNSWMMMLIGDPLYRPFANAPQLTLEQAMPAELIPAEFKPATRPSGQTASPIGDLIPAR